MTDKTVTFARKHIYGGQTFAAGDKLVVPAAKAEALKAVGALKAEKKKDD